MTPVRAKAAARGFTLVELMVAMAVGLVIALAVTGTVLTTGRQLKVVGSTSGAQSNALIALSAIDAAGRSAGAGLFANGSLVCPTLNAWKDGIVKSNGAVLMPARIADGGSNTASDTIVFTSSGSAGALSGTPLVDKMTSSVGSLLVSNAGAWAASDLALVGAPGSGQPCTLFQVTAAPTVGTACAGNATACKTLERASDPSTGYNAPAGTYAAEPLFGFANDAGATPPVYGPAVVTRLGTSFRRDAFAIQCDALVQYDAFSLAALPACTAPLTFDANVNAMATEVVQMHAQYGISAAVASDIVTSWVDATGATWAAPSAANTGLIKAIRVVVVTRSKEPEGTLVTAATCTNGGGVVNAGPCSFDDAQSPVIDLSAVAVPAGKSWRNYRYRVHKVVVPLRNVIWSSS